MSALTHNLRIRTAHWRRPPSLEELGAIASQINDRAQGRRMLGQISGNGDGKMRIRTASHIVLPTARVRGSSILVDIEVIEESSQGRTVAAFFRSGVNIRGVIRGHTGGLGGIWVAGVDVELDTVGTGYPAYTSQTCSSCGHRNPIPLSRTVFDCPCCELVLDRDHNAAKNILALGRQCLGKASP